MYRTLPLPGMRTLYTGKKAIGTDGIDVEVDRHHMKGALTGRLRSLPEGRA